MGITHAGHVLLLVGPFYEKYWRVNQHARNLLAVFDENQEILGKNRVSQVISEDTFKLLPDDRYWVATVEALFLANYREAECLLKQSIGTLQAAEAKDAYWLYPAVILGILKAALYGERLTPHNEAFVFGIPKAMS